VTQLLVYAADANLLGDNIGTVETKNFDASEEVGILVEVNAKKLSICYPLVSKMQCTITT
jgi:UDP-N-acetylglucosamine pyrophosphorylase